MSEIILAMLCFRNFDKMCYFSQVRNMNIESESSRDNRGSQSDIIVAIEEIASNVIAFCRSVVSKSGM